ncbi:MAG: ATP-binding protein [Spirochaetaceae bacterium]|nr:ATP-binding protein [Spirochaetaceae bacterium]
MEIIPKKQHIDKIRRGDIMNTLHLMVGLPCSGKTTKAKILEKEYNALLLTPDKWCLRLFGDDTMEKEHDKNHENVEEIQWEIAKRVLSLGIDVILDFGFWGKAERIYFRNKAKELGVNFTIHYMDIPKEELYKRLEERNKELPEGVFTIPKEEMDKYIKIFQPVEEDELIEKANNRTLGKWHNCT